MAKINEILDNPENSAKIAKIIYRTIAEQKAKSFVDKKYPKANKQQKQKIIDLLVEYERHLDKQ